jgi:hypothetical protein
MLFHEARRTGREGPPWRIEAERSPASPREKLEKPVADGLATLAAGIAPALLEL